MSAVPSPQSPADDSFTPSAQRTARARPWLGWSSLLFAFLQSVCTLLMAMSGLRLVIGIGSLALSAEATAFIDHLHANWIRIPMVLLALIGTLLNLVAILQIRRLRRRPSSQWRQGPVEPQKLRMEQWQLAIGVATLVLLVMEESFHLKLFHQL
jgi:fumarate reductase subunit C